MKKLLIVIAIVLTPILGVITAVAMEKQYVEPPVVEEKPYVPEKLSKYETGPPNATEVFELVNQERAEKGIKTLKRDKRLDKSAQLKADYMATNHTRDHKIIGHPEATLTPEMYQYTTHCQMTSENFTTQGLTSQQDVDSWKRSKPHYDAILDPKYSRTGVAIAYDEEQERTYVVQHFCQM